MRQRIIYTAKDNWVVIVTPSANAIRWMGSGGRWADERRGFIDEQIERHIAAGHNQDLSRRYVHAMMFGGCTTAEALGIIRDRDCAHRGSGIELWSVEDCPTDRWFRDAWRRHQDGGPIWIDLDAARTVQMQRCVEAVKNHNRQQEIKPELWGHNGPQFIELDYRRIKRDCESAPNLTTLRAIWPTDLRADRQAVSPA